MKRPITAVFPSALILLLLAGAACIGVRVRHDVRDADAYFDRALREIERLQAEDPGRRGPVHEVRALIHDRRSGDLIDVATPLWLAEACLETGMDAAGDAVDPCLEEGYDVEWRAFRELRRFGPGLLVDLHGEDNRVLVWLR